MCYVTEPGEFLVFMMTQPLLFRGSSAPHRLVPAAVGRLGVMFGHMAKAVFTLSPSFPLPPRLCEGQHETGAGWVPPPLYPPLSISLFSGAPALVPAL